MDTCASCGQVLAPTWKYCIHCGLAVDAVEVPLDGATPVADADDANPRISSRALIIAGVAIFVLGVALLVTAIVVTGVLR